MAIHAPEAYSALQNIQLLKILNKKIDDISCFLLPDVIPVSKPKKLLQLHFTTEVVLLPLPALQVNAQEEATRVVIVHLHQSNG